MFKNLIYCIFILNLCYYYKYILRFFYKYKFDQYKCIHIVNKNIKNLNFIYPKGLCSIVYAKGYVLRFNSKIFSF